MSRPARERPSIRRRVRTRLEKSLVTVVRATPPLKAWLAAPRMAPKDGRILDVDTAALLRLDDFVSRLSGYSSLPEKPEDCRDGMARQISVVDLAGPREVEVSSRRVDAPGRSIPVRAYVPLGLGTPSPAVVYFHGGGWVAGDLDTHDNFCRKLAAGAACRVFAVDYRRAPEAPFPAAVEDALAAHRWAWGQAAPLGVDPSRVAVAGDSAGGNLAAIVALRSRGAAHAPACQLLIYPVLDAVGAHASRATFAEGYFLTARMIGWFQQNYLGANDPRHPDVSPLFAEDHRKAAPAFIYTAGFDPLRDEGFAYADTLRAAGVEVHAREFETLVHGFAQMTRAVPAARAAVDEIIRDAARVLARR